MILSFYICSSVSSFNPSQQLTPHSPTRPLTPLQWDKRDNRKTKGEKNHSLRHRQFDSQSKRHAHKQSKMRNSFTLPIGRQVFSHFQESRAPSRITVTWEGKHHHSKHPLLPSSSPGFICWAWHHTIWNILLLRWGQLCQLCPFPTFVHSQSTHWWDGEEKKRPWLYKHCSANIKSIPALSTLFSAQI